MMIYKYALATIDEQEVMMPRGSKMLSVQMQYGSLQLWAEVEPTAEESPVTIFIVPTGGIDMPANAMEYIDTVQQLDGAIVWHIYKGL